MGLAASTADVRCPQMLLLLLLLLELSPPPEDVLMSISPRHLS